MVLVYPSCNVVPPSLGASGSQFRRAGLTLLEVLVAIFVMGIGLLAVLALFPLGALKMQDAIQAAKAAQGANMGSSIATMRGVRQDPFLSPTLTSGPYYTPAAGPYNGITAEPEGPSFPVLVDPVGFYTLGGAPSTLGANASPVSRSNASFVTGSTNAALWFTIQDDIDFEGTVQGTGAPGAPKLVTPGSFIRTTNYSYALLCQRPRFADASVVDLSVVVFYRRPMALLGGVSLPEYTYANSAFNPQNNTITVPYGGNVPPPIRSGNWIMDATFVPGSAANTGSAHGYFYRVVGVTENPGGAPNTVEFEVDSPIRGFPAAGGTGTVVVLDGVAHVSTKSTGRLP